MNTTLINCPKKFKFVFEKCKIIKKGWKITIIVVALLIAVLAGGYLSLQSSRVQTFITQKVANQLSLQTNAKFTIGKVDIAFFNKIILKDVLIEDQKSDTLIHSGLIVAKIDTLKFRKRKVSINNLTFENNKIGIERDSVNHFNFSFLLDSLSTEIDTSRIWDITCNQFGFLESQISFTDSYSKNKKRVHLNDLNVNIADFESRNDTIQLKLNDLSFNDGKRLKLEKLSAGFMASYGKIEIDSINMLSERSELSNSKFTFHLSDSVIQNNEPRIDLRINQSKLSLRELAELVPSIRGMDQNIFLSGRIYGDIDDLKGKNVVLRTGRETMAIVDFYINEILDPETMYLFLDLKQSKTTFSDLSKIKLPRSSNIINLEFPTSFYEAGTLNFTGNFSGFLSDFVTFGTLKSEMGILTTDVSVVPKENGQVQYRGNISTTDFQLGELLKNNTLGDITFSGEIDGNYNSSKKAIAGLFKGDIQKMLINNYLYKNIALDGIYMDKMFDGLLSINDPNLKFDFQGQIDLNSEDPDFNFNLQLDHFKPDKLNFSHNYPEAELGLKLRAKFTGKKIDNLKGVILVNDGLYKNSNGSVEIDNIQLISVPGDSTKNLTINSDFIDFEIEGDYYFQSLINSFRKTINHFLPAINYPLADNANNNTFNYKINVKNLDNLVQTFYPDLKFETPFLLYGKMKSEEAEFELEGSIPGIQYKNFWARNIFIANKTVEGQYSSKLNFGEILHRKGLKIHDFSIQSKVANNVTNNMISWNIDQDSSKTSVINTRFAFSASDSTQYPHIAVESEPTNIFIGDSIWQFEGFIANIDTSTIQVEKFDMRHRNQNMSIDGTISKDKSKRLLVDFNNFELDFLQNSLDTKRRLNGKLNCNVSISDLYDQPLILSDIGIENFMFKDYSIGTVNITSNWDRRRSLMNSEVKITKDDKQNFYAFGDFNPANNELNFDAYADSLSLKLLGAAVTKNLSEFDGFATGNVKIGGNLEKLSFNGSLFAQNAGLKVDYTQVRYNFDDFIHFKNDTIQFSNITIKDPLDNSGIFNGSLVHDNFQNMIYDLTMESSEILALNTSSRNADQLYGKVIADGKLEITGQAKTVRLDGSATTLKGTNVYISMDYESGIEQYDFVEFIKPEEEEDTAEEEFFAKNERSNLSLRFTIAATPHAKAQLVYNSRVGDIIKAQGQGILLFEMDKNGSVSLSGDYFITDGDYLFTLENVINKRFSIERGGTIVWSGDPYNAIIDLTAIYKLRAVLYDLLVEDTYGLDNSSLNKRIPVECKIMLTEELTNPTIGFGIDFPEENQLLSSIIQQYVHTDEEMNKQILSLIVLGKFYTPEYMRGQYEAQSANAMGTTASEMFSNQLSNWLSQISSNVDIGFNYRPGNSITDDEIELALSTQIFNDRVILNGNVGNNVNPESSSSSQIVGDFEIKAKLVPSGKVQFKAFNRSNNDLIYDTAPYTQGIGLSIKEEYNTVEELWKKVCSLFTKKER